MEPRSEVRSGERQNLHPVRVLSVPAAPPIQVRFLGPLEGLLTHWHRGRSVPCNAPQDCPIAVHRSGQIFKAYAPVLCWIPADQCWRPHVLEATANLEEYLRGRKLRGELWILSRESEKDKTSPVVGAYCSSLEDRDTPAAFDIRPILCRFFNRLELNLGAGNPMPRQIVLGDVAGAAPIIPADLQPPPPVQEDPVQRKKLQEILEEGRRTFGTSRAGQAVAGRTTSAR